METAKFISYAQNYEDVMLWRCFKHNKQGFYADVGACDPILHSVTQAFYERGWRGINMEPAHIYYERLCAERSHDINLQIAVADVEGSMLFYEIPETGLSTLDRETAQKYRREGWSVIEKELSVVTLDKIFEEHVNGPIHFLKIDVEGAEKKVLDGLNLSRWRPWVLIIEATTPNSTELSFEGWESSVIAAEYEMAYFDGLNRFYVAREHIALVEQLKTPPNIFDDFMSYSHKKALDELRQYDAWLKESEKDRTARWEQINQYDMWLKESQRQLSETQRALNEMRDKFEKITGSFIYKAAKRMGIFQ